MERLSDKLRAYIKAYKQPPLGREVEGTVELLQEAAGKLGHLEDLQEQGKLLELPCEIGQRVYEIYRFLDEGAREIDVHKIRLEDFDKIGKTVFLTREEAEEAVEALKRMEGGK